MASKFTSADAERQFRPEGAVGLASIDGLVSFQVFEVGGPRRTWRYFSQRTIWKFQKLGDPNGKLGN